MGLKTEIAWCDSTCNPAMGCDGCELPECYARRLVGRYAGHSGGYPASFDRPQLFLDRIAKALKWPDLTGKDRPDKPWLNGRPRHIFWCDLSDPFTPSLPEHWLAPYLREIGDSPHIHIFCTKQPQRARVFFERFTAPKNLILLTTVTSQATIWRDEELLRVPGISVRGLSLEPLLGPVYLPTCNGHADCKLSGIEGHSDKPLGGLDWVILGGESGSSARPMNPDWARKVQGQCQAAGVKFFFKQWNSRAAGRLLDGREWSEMPEVQ